MNSRGYIKLQQLPKRKPVRRGATRFFKGLGLCVLILAVVGAGLFLAVEVNKGNAVPFGAAVTEAIVHDATGYAFGDAINRSLPETEPAPEEGPAEATAAATVSETPIVNNEGPPRIYLTFDDGPSAVSTPKILDILNSYNVKATFFVLGTQAEARPDMIRAAAAAGHTVANHGYSHDYASVYATPESFIQDMKQCEGIVAGILGESPPRIVRFIGGTTVSQLEDDPAKRDAIKQMLTAEGWRYFDWNASMEDSIAGPGPAQGVLGGDLIASIDEKVAYGIMDIVVLAHDTNARTWTPTDLPMVIEHCLAKGYTFEVLTNSSPTCAFR